MGVTVFCINYFSVYEITGSITAALKQAAYTFILGGTLKKSTEYLSVSIKNKNTALLSAVLIPSVFTLILTFTIHSMKGTPKPLESTLPTTVIIPATLVWAYKKRKGFESGTKAEMGK